MIERPILLYIARFPADHDTKLYFPIGLCRAARNDDVIIRATNSAGRLEEEHRLGGHLHAGFRSMICVIKPYTDELSDTPDASADASACRNEWKHLRVKHSELFEIIGIQNLPRNIGYDLAQITHAACSINQSWPFFTRASVTYQFHMLLHPPSIVMMLPVI